MMRDTGSSGRISTPFRPVAYDGTALGMAFVEAFTRARRNLKPAVSETDGLPL